MKIQHRSSVPALALALSTMIALSGCQTLGENATLGAATGIAAGCAGGTALAILAGEHPAKGCAVGAAVGVVSGYFIGRQKDLAFAQRTRDDIARAGVAEVALKTRNESVPADQRTAVKGAQSVEVVDKMVVNVPQALVARRDQRVGETLNRVGAYVSGAEASSRVIVAARTQADYEFIVEGIRQGYTQEAAPPKVVFEHRPQNRGAQSAIEVVHRA